MAMFVPLRQSSFLLAGFLSSFSVGLIHVAFSLVLGKVFSLFAAYGSHDGQDSNFLLTVSRYCTFLTVLGALALIISAILMFSWSTFGDQQLYHSREGLFRKLLGQSRSWYDLQPGGSPFLLIRLDSNLSALKAASSHPLGILTSTICTTIASLFLSFYTCWRLAAALCATIPLGLAILDLLRRIARSSMDAQTQESIEAMKSVSAALKCPDLIGLCQSADVESWKYSKALRKSAHYSHGAARAIACQFALIKFWSEAVFVIGFYYGIHLFGLDYAAGDIVTTFYSVLMALHCLETGLPTYFVVQRGLDAGRELRDALEDGEEQHLKPLEIGSGSPGECSGDITFHDVTFAYPIRPLKPVLQGVTLFFPAGELCFILGKNGAGKSTFGDLLVKLYEPNKGYITIDGRRLDAMETIWVRQNVTLLQQSSVILDDTLSANITLSEPGDLNALSLQDHRPLYDLAPLAQLLGRLPRGWDSMISENGHSLSQGQQQIVCLARALVRNTPVLVLDEPTSALDTASSYMVMEAVRRWRGNKTTIVITHDPSLIQDNEYSYVLDGGAVSQQGFKKQLRLGHEETACHRRKRQSARSLLRSPLTPNFSRPLTAGSQRCISAWSEVPRRPSVLHLDEKRTVSDPVGMSPEDPATRRRSMPDAQVYNVSSNGESRPGRVPETKMEQPSSSLVHDNCDGGVTGGSESFACSAINTLHEPTSSPIFPLLANRKHWVSLPSVSTWHIYQSLWITIPLRWRLMLCAVIVMCIIVGVSVPVFAYCLAELLSAYSQSSPGDTTTTKFTIYLILIALAGSVTTFISHYLLSWLGGVWITQLQLEIFSRILRQPVSWHDPQGKANCNIEHVFDHNAHKIRPLVGPFASHSIIAFVTGTTSILWAMSISWRLTLVTVAPITVLILVASFQRPFCQHWKSCHGIASNTATAIMKEAVEKIRVVQTYQIEPFFMQKHTAAADATFREGIRGAAWGALFYSISQAIPFLMLALMFWYTAQLLMIEQTSLHSTLRVINLLLIGLSTSAGMIGSIPAITGGQAAASEMLYYSSIPVDPDQDAKERTGKSLTTLFPIVMTGMTFSYGKPQEGKTLLSQLRHNESSNPGRSPALLDINLRIEAGTSTAIVGASGCGKTTLTKIIMGLLQPFPASEPPLSYANIPWHEISPTSLKRMIAYVPQEPFLFPLSIFENITYGLPEQDIVWHSNDNTRVVAAARAASIHDFIVSLPEGYHTIVGDGGLILSGGQTQRICLARALVRRPKLLVMDEPTASLDRDGAASFAITIRNLISAAAENRNQSADYGRHSGFDSWDARVRTSGLWTHERQQDRQTTLLLDADPELAVVFITHDIACIESVDRIVVMGEGGRIVQEGSFDQLLDQKHGELSRLIGSHESSIDGCR